MGPVTDPGGPPTHDVVRRSTTRRRCRTSSRRTGSTRWSRRPGDRGTLVVVAGREHEARPGRWSSTTVDRRERGEVRGWGPVAPRRWRSECRRSCRSGPRANGAVEGPPGCDQDHPAARWRVTRTCRSVYQRSPSLENSLGRTRPGRCCRVRQTNIGPTNARGRCVDVDLDRVGLARRSRQTTAQPATAAKSLFDALARERVSPCSFSGPGTGRSGPAGRRSNRRDRRRRHWSRTTSD